MKIEELKDFEKIWRNAEKLELFYTTKKKTIEVTRNKGDIWFYPKTASLDENLIQFSNIINNKFSEINFSDSEKIQEKAYVDLACKIGLFTGMPDGSFRPDEKITMNQLLTLAGRLVILKMNKKEYVPLDEQKSWPDNYIKFCVDNEIITLDGNTDNNLTLTKAIEILNKVKNKIYKEMPERLNSINIFEGLQLNNSSITKELVCKMMVRIYDDYKDILEIKKWSDAFEIIIQNSNSKATTIFIENADVLLENYDFVQAIKYICDNYCNLPLKIIFSGDKKIVKDTCSWGAKNKKFHEEHPIIVNIIVAVVSPLIINLINRIIEWVRNNSELGS